MSESRAVKLEKIKAVREASSNEVIDNAILDLQDELDKCIGHSNEAIGVANELNALSIKYRKGNLILSFVGIPLGILCGYLLAGII